MRMNDRRALTLTDVVVLASVVALLIGAGLPLLTTRTRESSGRIKCASNLRQIGYGVLLYANENNQQFPRTYFDMSVDPVPTHYTGWQSPNPFGPGGPAPNDVTAGLFLILRTQDLTSEVFVCPSTPRDRWHYEGNDKAQVSNFPSREFLTYSYINPYPTETARTTYKRFGSPPALAVAADMNPGSPEVLTVTPTSPRTQLSPANSPNHGGDGQNVLYMDGHAEWMTTPFIEPADPNPIGTSADPPDNIFAAASDPSGNFPARIAAAPRTFLDSVLLPTVRDGYQPPGPIGEAPLGRDDEGPRSSRVLYYVLMGIVLIGGPLLFWLRRRKLRRNAAGVSAPTP